MEQIEKYLAQLIKDPENDHINFELAYAYEKEKQYAAAISYYLRCAEYTSNNTLASECLIRCSFSISKQGGRDQKELHYIKQAMGASPCSLETYHVASLYFSWRGEYRDSYLYSCLGINIHENNLQKQPFSKEINFSIYDLYCQKAICGSKIGKFNEARQIYIKILQNFKLSNHTRSYIINNVNALKRVNHPIISYNKDKKCKLKYQFQNYEKINENFSQIYQDIFVLSMTNGKKEGTYLEVGAGYPKKGNNTFLLEKEFDWKGVSIDINPKSKELFDKNRKNESICADATSIDYIQLLSEHYKSTSIDYLQLDCDPANITYDILQKIPFDNFKFGVITYEHDFYNDSTGSYREKSRVFLKGKGYKLICGNISPLKDKYPFEDWWIHPDLIDENIWKQFERMDDLPINGEKYMLTKCNNHEIVKALVLSNNILDNFILKNSEFFDFDTNSEKSDYFTYYNNLSGTNEYRLYSYLSTLFNNITILDIGTGYGTSAIALSHNETNQVISYNIVDQIGNDSKLKTKKNIIFKIKNVLEDLNEEFIKNVKIVMIDIDHFGEEEKKIINKLEELNYSGIILLDDIHHPWEKESKCMKQLWDYIKYTKYDITKYGHSTGTGIFLMNFNIDIIFSELHENEEKYMLTKSKYIQNPIEEKAETIIDNKNVAFWDNKLCKNIIEIDDPHNDKIYCPKIIDCFIFYNELDLLNYRLNLLDDYVDYFVLVEAVHTHIGKEKKLFYNENKELFEKFKDKIIHVIVDDFPYKYPNINIEKNEQWENEHFQRNCIKRGIDKLSLNDNDIITICDLDEIPNPEIFKEIKENKRKIEKISSLRMDMYYYNLNCKTNIDDWISPKIISYKEFTKLDITIHDFRYKKTDNIIENGGWHLSYFGDKEFIANKIENNGHQEFNNDEMLKNIEEKIKTNKDLFDRETKFPGYKIRYIDIEDNENLPPKYDIYLQKYFTLDIKENTNLIKDFYDFIPCHDQTGNDMYRVKVENVKQVLKKEYNNPQVKGVNTRGYVKNNIEKLEQINGWGWDVKANKADGIYIKKTSNNTLVKCSKSSIPVLGTLVCTTTKWIEKQIQSIDFPVENYIIINNNENFLAEKLDILVSKGNKFIKNFKVYHMPYNLGCAEGWNTIIKSFLFSPYWVIVNDDVSFTPGFLKELHETALENPDAGLIHGNPCNLNYLRKFGSFDMFLIRDWIIKDFGLFDTNFYPAYKEDCDYIFRLRNSSVKIINQLKHKYYHGDTFHYSKSGQNTKKFSNELSNKLINIRYKNFNYFYKKWNSDIENINESNVNDIYKYPFNNPSNKLSMSLYDIEFAREKSLQDILPSCKKENNAFEIAKHGISFPRPNVIVIDDFYKNVDEIRNYALSQIYQPPENHGAVGYRCESGKKIMDGTKEMFETLLGGTIPNGNQHGEWGYSTNGCFQWCNVRVPIVYHCDSQKYAAIIYLTPNAPPNCGTSFFRHKNYKIRNSSIFSKSDWYKSDLNHKEPHLDKTQWEIVDSVGNVYNRLVIFDAQYIHAVTEYFGEDINNSRLFQLFFFNIN